MVREGLLCSNKYEKKCCYAEEILSEVYICKLPSSLDKTSPHFAWYGKIPAFMKSEHLDVASNQSLCCLKRWMKEHNKYYAWVTLAEEQQLNGGS